MNEASNGFNFRKEKIEEFYDIKEELGRGQFAVVKKCVSKENGEYVAAKFIKLKRTRTSKAGLSRELIEREAAILSSLNHDKVIKLYDVFDLGPEMVLVLEILAGGELFEKICESEYLTELDACCYMKQVLLAIEHLHDSSIVHLDIKPENIVLKSPDATDIKLVDFGLAQRLEPGKDLREMMGTPEFVAPEVINYETIGFYTDMWAIGVLAYILLSGCSPFLGDDNQETYANIVEVDYHFDEEYFEKISVDAKLFVSELLVKTPRNRSTVKDCLTHPWLLEMSGPRKRHDSSLIATGRFKAFVARRRWQQSFQKLNAITRFSKFLKRGGLPIFAEESTPDSPTSTLTLTAVLGTNDHNALKSFSQDALHNNTQNAPKSRPPSVKPADVEIIKKVLHSVESKKKKKRKIKPYVPLDDDDDDDDYSFNSFSDGDSSLSSDGERTSKVNFSDIVDKDAKRIHGTLELWKQKKGSRKRTRIVKIRRQGVKYASLRSNMMEVARPESQHDTMTRNISIDDFKTEPEVMINADDFAPDFKFSKKQNRDVVNRNQPTSENDEDLVFITPRENENKSTVEVYVGEQKGRFTRNQQEKPSSIEVDSDSDSVFVSNTETNFHTSTPRKEMFSLNVSLSNDISFQNGNHSMRSLSIGSAYEIIEVLDRFEDMEIQTVEERGAVETEYIDRVNITNLYETIDLEERVTDNDSLLIRHDSVSSQRSLTPRTFDNDLSNNNPMNKVYKTYGGYVFDFDFIEPVQTDSASSLDSNEIDFNMFDDYVVIDLEKKKLTWNDKNMSGLYVVGSPSTSPCVSPGPEDTTFSPISSPSSEISPISSPSNEISSADTQQLEDQNKLDQTDESAVDDQSKCVDKDVNSDVVDVAKLSNSEDRLADAVDDRSIHVEDSDIIDVTKQSNSKDNDVQNDDPNLISDLEKNVNNKTQSDEELAGILESNVVIVANDSDDISIANTNETTEKDEVCIVQNNSKEELSNNINNNSGLNKMANKINKINNMEDGPDRLELDKNNVDSMTNSESTEQYVNKDDICTSNKEDTIPSIEIDATHTSLQQTADKLNPSEESPSRLRKESAHSHPQRKYSREPPVHYTQMFLEEKRRQMMKEGSFASVDENKTNESDKIFERQNETKLEDDTNSYQENKIVNEEASNDGELNFDSEITKKESDTRCENITVDEKNSPLLHVEENIASNDGELNFHSEITKKESDTRRENMTVDEKDSPLLHVEENIESNDGKLNFHSEITKKESDTRRESMTVDEKDSPLLHVDENIASKDGELNFHSEITKKESDTGRENMTVDEKDSPLLRVEENIASNDGELTFDTLKGFDIRDTKGCKISGRKKAVFIDHRSILNDESIKNPNRSLSLKEQRKAFILGSRSHSVDSATMKTSDVIKLEPLKEDHSALLNDSEMTENPENSTTEDDKIEDNDKLQNENGSVEQLLDENENLDANKENETSSVNTVEKTNIPKIQEELHIPEKTTKKVIHIENEKAGKPKVRRRIVPVRTIDMKNLIDVIIMDDPEAVVLANERKTPYKETSI